MRHLAKSGDSFGCHNWQGVPLASDGAEAGILLNILQYTEEPTPPHLQQTITHSKWQ